MTRVDDILDRIFGPGVDSGNRLSVMIGALTSGPMDAGIFWPVFLETWPSCDATWHWRTELVALLKAAAGQSLARAFMDDENAAFFDNLPASMTIYRGCSASRVRGISWTADRAVAVGFSHGHRGIKVPNPVVAEAQISKDAVFCTFTGRRESEALVNPRRLRKLQMQS